MASIYSVIVDTNNGKHTSCGFNADSLGEAVSEAIKQASYFYFVCGYQKPSFTITRICAECCGEGKVPAKRKYVYKVCPSCRNKEGDVSEAILQSEFAMHDNVDLSHLTRKG